jgi:hypothetical protein
MAWCSYIGNFTLFTVVIWWTNTFQGVWIAGATIQATAIVERKGRLAAQT